jgi:hypothetical protein
MDCKRSESQLGYTLSVHHIDLNKCNNSAENLVALCRNCHRRRHAQPIERASVAYRPRFFKFWSVDEINTLKASYTSATMSDLRRLLPGRHPATIRTKAMKLGLAKGARVCQGRICPIWSAEELTRLRCLWPTTPMADLLRAFPTRRRSALISKACRLGLRREAGLTIRWGWATKKEVATRALQ